MREAQTPPREAPAAVPVPKTIRAGHQGRFAWGGPVEATIRWSTRIGRASNPIALLPDAGLRITSTNGSWTLDARGRVVDTRSSPLQELAEPPMRTASGTTAFAGGKVIRLVANDSRVVWEVPLSSPLSAGAIMTAQGHIVATTTSGTVLAIDEKGDEAWKVETPYTMRATPALSFAGRVVIPVQEGRLLAFSALTGDVEWDTPLAGAPRDTAQLALRGEAFVGTEAGLEAYSREGDRLWVVRREHGATGPAMARGGRLYSVDGGGTLLAVSPAGDIEWHISVGGAPTVAPIMDGHGVVYVAHSDGEITAVADRGDHAAIRWSIDLGTPVSVAPALGPGGVLYAALRDGTISAIGRPLDGHGGVCSRWANGSGRVCEVACQQCGDVFDRCYSDPGCESIARCVLETSCSSATGCALPSTCGAVIDTAGGLSSDSFRRATALGACATQTCEMGAR